MSLPPEYMQYPMRRHGMDHDRYPWSSLTDRPRIEWPGGARVALWVTPILQWFPLNMTATPFLAPGGLTMPYPDYRHYTNRDYGNRVGIFRILDLLDRYKLAASTFVNAAIAERYPSLLRDLVGRKIEIVGHGLDMGHLHHSGLSEVQEAELVKRSCDVLASAAGQSIKGWLSPGRSQSWHTLDILAAHGIEYCCDWANDDMPYEMHTSGKDVLSMPLVHESDDRMILQEFRHTEEDWLAQTKDRFDVLYREAERYGGRIMSLPLHAWIMGVPYRATYLREALEYIAGHDKVWVATGQHIAAEFRRQTTR
ncbi:polysaccharide deacetylase family protein [Peristeroidobacter soli]|uniref:polysaccharide deacetylase family protein n=1 Tax=Peristeroidobacter soli TaxID=2497877 RepID=UPI00101C6AB2|nr:polysaccharide deacetylase family protein [Peristeroidobacter soli]